MSCDSKKWCNNNSPCVSDDFNCTDMYSCKSCENLVETAMSDEELDQEDYCGKKNKEDI